MKTGRPSKYREAFHPDDLLKWSQKGRSITEICATWSISRDTYYDWRKRYHDFSDADKMGRTYAEAWWIAMGRDAMLGNLKNKDGRSLQLNVGLYVWMTKRLFRWGLPEKPNEDTGNDAVYDVEFGDGSSAPRV